MAALGEFIVRTAAEGKSRNYFVPAGSDLLVDSGSVSSEWTTEDEGELPEGSKPPPPPTVVATEGEPKKNKRRVRKWRVRYKPQRRSATSSSSDDSVSTGRSGSDTSSSTSSGSSSTGDGAVARYKKQRRQVLQEWKEIQQQGLEPAKGACGEFGSPARDANSPLPPSAPLYHQPPLPLERQPLIEISQSCGQSAAVEQKLAVVEPLRWFPAEKRYRCVSVSPAFLNQDDIRCIHLAAKHSSVKEINDRKGYLAFKHRVWRFELQLHALYPRLYAKLLGLMATNDAAKWHRLRKGKRKKLYPEIEYIEYDVAAEGEPCFIEPHIDNKSAVTIVAMLSQPHEYAGGRSCFRRADGKRGHREMQLQQGDVVAFRGEKLLHWISPVTAGKRIILQIELSRV